MPDSESAQVKLTVTSVLFQPLTFAAGAALPTIVGGVLSIRIVIVFVVLFPALSVIVCARVVTPSADDGLVGRARHDARQVVGAGPVHGDRSGVPARRRSPAPTA